MVKLVGPLHSMLASGLLQTGLQLVQKKSSHLVRPHCPRTTFTRAQLNLRTFVESLACAWQNYPPVYKYAWARHPRAQLTSPYHAYLWENHKRRMANLWPLMLWDTTPTGTPPAAAGVTWRAAARTITLRLLGYTGLRAMFLAGDATPLAVAMPLNVRAWSWESPTDFREHHIHHLAAGTYTAQFRYIDAFGRMSYFSGQAGLVVTA